MALVLAGERYRNVKTAYMRNTGPDETLAKAGVTNDVWVVYDDEGRKCLTATDRSFLFYWAHDHSIDLATVH